MASSPRASAAVPPEGEMEVDFGDMDPVEPEDEDWQVVTAEQEAQNLADASSAAPEDLDEKMKIQMEDLQQTIGRLRLGADASEQAEEWSRSLDSQAQSSEDVAMADSYVEPRPKSKPMAGFVIATCPASLPQPIRFKLDPENHAYSKLVMFPESFPSIPNYLVNMPVGTDEFELTELFARFMEVPLSGPAVTRIIEAYIPMKSMCDQEAVWGLNYTKGTSGLGSKPLKARDTGTMSYDFLLPQCLGTQGDQVLPLQEGRKDPLWGSWGNFAGGGRNLAHVPSEWQAVLDSATGGLWCRWPSRVPGSHGG